MRKKKKAVKPNRKPNKSQKKGLGLVPKLVSADGSKIVAIEDQTTYVPDPILKEYIKPMNFEFNILKNPAVMYMPGLPILKITHK